MSLWLTVTLLQMGIFVACVLFGTAFLRLRLSSAILASVFMMPAPLYQVAGGAGSWIYPSDLIGLWFALEWLFGRNAGPAVYKHRKLLLLVALVLVAMPLLSTLVGLGLNAQPRAWKFVALQVVRSVGYFFAFRGMMARATREERPDAMLILQCFGFAMLCALGILQYKAGFNLDLWNATVASEADFRGLGGGFMALYRGAVGAWAVGILAVAPAVMTNRKMHLFLPVVTVAIFGGILAVGTRQGLVIGAVAFALGIVASLRVIPRDKVFITSVRYGIILILLVVAGIYGWNAASADDRFRGWMTRRFEVVTNTTQLLENALARDGRVPYIYDALMNNSIMLVVGTGYGVEQIAPVNGGFVHTYVDSEIFYMWQLGGTPLLLGYAVILLAMLWSLRRSQWPGNTVAQTVPAAAIAALQGGILLMWGHFFLLTTFSHNAPVGYWYWGTLGLALGLCGQGQQQSVFQAIGTQYASEQS